MRSILVLIVVLFYGPIVVADSSAALSAKMFLESYISGDFEEASKQLHCPTKYTSEKIKEEQNQLVGEFARMSKEFGKALSYEVVSVGLSTTVIFGCGAKEDHENINPIGVDMVDVFYEGNKKGRINIYYIKASGKPVLGMVGIGEASLMPGAIGRQYDLFKELKDSPNNGS